MDSILLTTKQLLGLAPEYTAFDLEIKTHINTVLMILSQMGVGRADFILTDETSTWQDFIGDRKDLAGIRTYVGMKVRLMFDPPQNGSLKDALEQNLQEIEWRLFIACNSNKTFKTESSDDDE